MAITRVCVMLLILQLVSCAPTIWKCNDKDKKQADEIAARIMTIGTSRPFPMTREELKVYCKEQLTLIDRLESYKNQCNTGQAKNIVSVIVYSIKSVVNSYCKHPGSKRSMELLESAKCANAAPYGNCQIEYIERLWASEKASPQEKLRQACCGYVGVYKCMQTQTKGIRQCTTQNIELNWQYIKRFFEAAVDVICGEYNENTDRCDKLRAPVFKKKENTKYPPSFFGPVVKVLSEL